MERIDFLPNHEDVKIIQNDELFLINTDTQVLGEFIKVYKNDVVLDMGTNTGALLLYANLFKPKKLIGLDINKKALEYAKRNLELNNANNFELINENLINYKGEEVDVLICNPPYFKTESDNLSLNKYKNLAKHETNDLTLDLLIRAINRNLKDSGTLYFLFLTSRLQEVMICLNKYNIAVKDLKFIYDENKSVSNVFILKGVKNKKMGMNVYKPIIINRNEIDLITEKGNPANPIGLYGEKMLKRMNKSHLEITSLGLSKIDFNDDDICLDIGCGGGETVRRIAKSVKKVYGIDISDVAVNMSKQLNESYVLNGKVEIIKGNVLDLPFKDETFNHIISVESFYFWKDYKKSLNEINRVLKTNGDIVIVLEIHGDAILTDKQLENVKKYDLYNPTISEIKELFNSSNFKDISFYRSLGETYLIIKATKQA